VVLDNKIGKINNPAINGGVFHTNQSLRVDCPRSVSKSENSETLSTLDQSLAFAPEVSLSEDFPEPRELAKQSIR